MSTRRTPRSSPAKRVPYKPPRDRRELLVAIGAAVLIVVVTAALVWFLRPNRDSGGGSTESPVITAPTTLPTESTGAPTDSTTAPTDTTGAPTDTTQAPDEPATSSP
jgi:hypothetical protein